MSTISTFELFKMFPDQESARVYLEGRLWKDGVKCLTCKSGERITVRKGGYYRCNACQLDFTVRTGTIFERSHIPLHKWLYAMYLLVTARKGISSLQLSKEIGVTQKSAWFMLHRLREACGNDINKLGGIVEIDETYVGGKEANKHADKKLRQGRGAVGKQIVLGFKARDGHTRATVVEANNMSTIERSIFENVQVGSTIYTDEHASYGRTGGLFFTHKTVNHSLGIFARGRVHTNGIESFWALFKRGILGVYHHTSDRHLHRYVNEFSFRLNFGNVKIDTLQRLNSFVDAAVGKHLTYKELIS